MGANLQLSVFFLSLCSTSYSLLTVSTVAKMGLSCACTLTMATFVFPKKRYVRNRRSAATCPNGQINDPNGNCVDDIIPQRQGMSAGNQPGLLIGSRPCRSECTCEDNEKGDNEGLSWCSFGTSYNWGWCDHPHPKKPQSGSRPCVFPFKYNGVMYNECTDVQWRNKWCATATNRRDEYVGAWGDCEIRESV